VESIRQFLLYMAHQPSEDASAPIVGRIRKPALRNLILCFFFYAAGLTTKEVVVALPLFLGVLWLVSRWTSLKARPTQELKQGLLILLPFVALNLIYLYLRLHGQPVSSEGNYRLGYNATEVRLGIMKLLHWTLRYFPHAGQYTDPYHRVIVNAFGWLLTLTGLCGIGSLLVARKSRALRGVLAVTLPGLICFALVPIYSGGYPWHYSLSALFYAILWGFAFRAGLLERIRRPRTQVILLAFTVLLLTTLDQANFRSFLDTPQNRSAYVMNLEALRHPPIPSEKVNDRTIILLLNSTRQDPWAYGLGNLFPYVYENPHVRQYVLSASPPSELQWLLTNTDPVLCVDWDGASEHWQDLTEGCRTRIQAEAAQRR
jgi:hypothetical protein